MDASDVTEILAGVAAGRLAVEDAAELLRSLPYGDVGTALLDHHRSLRQGLPEAVYAPGKSSAEVGEITAELLRSGTGPVIVSRADSAQQAAVEAICALAGVDVVASGPSEQRTLVARPAPRREPSVLIVTAGTSDGPVAEEAESVLIALGYAASLGSIASSSILMSSLMQKPRLSWPAWKAPLRQWWADSLVALSSLCPPLLATVPLLKGLLLCFPCFLLVLRASPWWVSITASVPPWPSTEHLGGTHESACMVLLCLGRGRRHDAWLAP